MIFVTTGTILNENLNNNYNPYIQKLYSFFFFFLETVLLFAGFLKKILSIHGNPFYLLFFLKLIIM